MPATPAPVCPGARCAPRAATGAARSPKRWCALRCRSSRTPDLLPASQFFVAATRSWPRPPTARCSPARAPRGRTISRGPVLGPGPRARPANHPCRSPARGRRARSATWRQTFSRSPAAQRGSAPALAPDCRGRSSRTAAGLQLRQLFLSLLPPFLKVDIALARSHRGSRPGARKPTCCVHSTHPHG